jgi:hypothetical protein
VHLFLNVSLQARQSFPSQKVEKDHWKRMFGWMIALPFAKHKIK